MQNIVQSLLDSNCLHICYQILNHLTRFDIERLIQTIQLEITETPRLRSLAHPGRIKKLSNFISVIKNYQKTPQYIFKSPIWNNTTSCINTYLLSLQCCSDFGTERGFMERYGSSDSDYSNSSMSTTTTSGNNSMLSTGSTSDTDDEKELDKDDSIFPPLRSSTPIKNKRNPSRSYPGIFTPNLSQSILCQKHLSKNCHKKLLYRKLATDETLELIQPDRTAFLAQRIPKITDPILKVQVINLYQIRKLKYKISFDLDLKVLLKNLRILENDNYSGSARSQKYVIFKPRFFNYVSRTSSNFKAKLDDANYNSTVTVMLKKSDMKNGATTLETSSMETIDNAYLDQSSSSESSNEDYNNNNHLSESEQKQHKMNANFKILNTKFSNSMNIFTLNQKDPNFNVTTINPPDGILPIVGTQDDGCLSPIPGETNRETTRMAKKLKTIYDDVDYNFFEPCGAFVKIPISRLEKLQHQFDCVAVEITYHDDTRAWKNCVRLGFVDLIVSLMEISA